MKTFHQQRMVASDPSCDGLVARGFVLCDPVVGVPCGDSAEQHRPEVHDVVGQRRVPHVRAALSALTWDKADARPSPQLHSLPILGRPFRFNLDGQRL